MLLNPKTVLSHKLFADLVILNANVITVDDKNPKAEAFAVKYEKIAAVGAISEIKGLIGKNTRRSYHGN